MGKSCLAFERCERPGLARAVGLPVRVIDEFERPSRADHFRAKFITVDETSIDRTPIAITIDKHAARDAAADELLQLVIGNLTATNLATAISA